MKTFDIPKSGKRGSVVAFKSRFGQCERELTRSQKPRTAAQLTSQSDFGAASARWDYLTEDQRKACRDYGKKVRSHPRGGQSGPLTGQNLYTAINFNQAALGLPRLLYPPERPAFGPNPVVALSITRGRAGPALKLRLSRAPAGLVLVYASRPYNAGRQYCDKFSYLGPITVTTAGECDIAARYVKQHGNPAPGTRVILRIVQQINGWRNLPQRIEAVFQAKEAPAARPKRR